MKKNMKKDIYNSLSQQVECALKALKTEGFLPDDLDTKNVVVEQPKDLSHGDFATNAAMVLAKAARKNPREIAMKLAELLEGKAGIASIDVAGPGFINFKMENKCFHEQIETILAQGVDYGKSNIGADEKVMVEFVSVNPTGPLHAGHGRGAVYGDALCRLLTKAGYDVYREYLMNDAGGQMRVIVKSVHLRYLELFGQKIEMPEGCYPGDYVKDIAQTLKERDGDKWLSTTDDEELFKALRAFCVEECMNMINDAIVHDMDIKFDNYFSEYDMHARGEMDNAIKKLTEKGYIYKGVLAPPKGKVIEDYEAEEMTLFKAEQFGDDCDRPVYKKNGEPTYFGADVAYHNNKLERGFTKLINVWGADHAGAVKRLKAALTALTGNKDALHIQLMQMVKLVKNGKEVKLSKRAGNIIEVSDVVKEVGADAFRFLYLFRKHDSQFTFDLAKAVEKNNENPVFYVQYAHARICSIFRQQKELGIDESTSDVNLALLDQPAELKLIKQLCLFPLVIEKAAKMLEPHRVAFYAHELASHFHSLYGAEKFLLPEDVALTHARLKLVKAAQVTLKASLEVLGVNPVTEM
ncbi:MAG: arginyl-tRNA synthetase [Alphaproteobacteria bacterium]|jgi:arginyl-tRNA synthetase